VRIRAAAELYKAGKVDGILVSGDNGSADYNEPAEMKSDLVALGVPAGTLHAIMGGLAIAEIQQNSNTTYRVYDWGGADGQPRPLQVDKAKDVIDFDRVEPGVPRPSVSPRRTATGASCSATLLISSLSALRWTQALNLAASATATRWRSGAFSMARCRSID